MFARLGKWLLILSAVFMTLGLLIWFSLPMLAEKWLPELAEEQGIKEFSVSIQGMGWKGLSIRRLRGVLESPHGPVQLIARDAVLGFSHGRNEPIELDVREMHVHWWQKVPQEAANAPPLVPPQDLPLFGIHVRQLHMQLETLQGRFELQGVLRLAHPVPGWYTASFTDPAYQLALKLRTSLKQAELQLKDHAGNVVARAAVEDLLAADTAGQLQMDAAALRRWWSDSHWLPASILQTLADVPEIEGQVRLDLARQDGALSLQADLRKLAVELPELRMQGDLLLQLAQAQEQWTLQVMKPTQIQLWPRAAEADLEGPIRLLPAKGLRVELRKTDQGLRDMRGDGRLGFAAGIHGRKLQGELTEWRIPRWDPQQGPPPRGTLQLRQLNVTGLPLNLPAMGLRGQWQLQGKELVASGTAGPEGESWLDWSAWHWLARGDGYLDATIRQPISQLWNILEKLPALDGVVVDGGQLDSHVHIGWQHANGLSGRAEFSASKVSGSVSKLRFQELELQGQASRLFQPELDVHVRLPRLVLGNGIEVQNLQLDGGLQESLLALRDAKLQVFDGELAVAKMQHSIGQPMQTVQINARHIGLAELFRGIGQEGLSGTGHVDGKLPVRLVGKALSVTDAHLFSDDKGVIRYTGPGSAIQAENPNIAVQALENFHYDSLDARLEYTPDGKYQIRVKLSGSNPDLYGGYPIRLNLNLEGTLPGLIRDSLLSGDFSREVMKQIEQGGDPAASRDSSQ